MLEELTSVVEAYVNGRTSVDAVRKAWEASPPVAHLGTADPNYGFSEGVFAALTIFGMGDISEADLRDDLRTELAHFRAMAA